MKLIVQDTNLIFTIIAINMTVIGLTSLADMKSVIGIDYGKFLIKKYKIFGFIRIYYLLIAFACINAISMFTIFVPSYVLKSIHFGFLVGSLIFAIYYFFAFIIVENTHVRRKITEQEILGHYYASNNKTQFNPDVITEVFHGSRTQKKLSNNVIQYFNTYSTDSSEAFEEVFGPSSVIYDYSKQRIKKFQKVNSGLYPYIYRYSVHKVPDISHEFFQMYRYSEIQDRWILDILYLFNKNCKNAEFDYIQLCNFTRVVGQINFYGTTKNLFTVKYFDYIFTYFKQCVVDNKLDGNAEVVRTEIKKIHSFVVEEIYKYLIRILEKSDKDSDYKLIITYCYKILFTLDIQTLSKKEVLIIVVSVVGKTDNKKVQSLISSLVEIYEKYQKMDKKYEYISKSEIRRMLQTTDFNNLIEEESLRLLLFS